MLENTDVGLSISMDAQARLKDELAKITEFSAMPGLLWGRNHDEGVWRWTIGYYDRRVVEGEDFMGLLINISDFEIVVPKPQQQLVSNLEGMVLDVRAGKFVVV